MRKPRGGDSMPKTFTRTRRRMSSTRGRNRATRQKTFQTKEAAKKWAESKGLTNYRLEDLKPNSTKYNKIRVVTKD